MTEDDIEKAIANAMDPVPQPQPQPAKQDPMRIVENHLVHLDKVLTHLRKNEADLLGDIARLTSQLRQTRASIEAFGLAHDRLRP
jgi:hypothetical protein